MRSHAGSEASDQSAKANVMARMTGKIQDVKNDVQKQLAKIAAQNVLIQNVEQRLSRQETRVNDCEIKGFE